ncbi:RICIN domain-containing protein [Neptuniibacter caesariensis]|uniref:Ricin B lectin domain-containing protein n=1 Tax=Neptuniibacter caesariensis TaxID=207954 RepID=A0A7U8C824_NEPCE|nr:RICIN domain-containing protein [Neptuniibacter caesariensis]EAR61929.1 hypothetical protein MED92_03238 [Oceanospirillum sp. MED92] [Neptuniibacter caesariensis]
MKNPLPIATLLLSFATYSYAEGPKYIQLVDKLDRPEDGYCLDVVGSGDQVRLDMPLTSHNCKGPQPYHDEIVDFRDDGTLFFPAYRGCVTVMGVNQIALAGNALMLKRCGAVEPFLNGPAFQHFKHKANGQFQLLGSNLCIVSGKSSHTTYSPDHKWRSLYMEDCDKASLPYSAWKVAEAGYE